MLLSLENGTLTAIVVIYHVHLPPTFSFDNNIRSQNIFGQNVVRINVLHPNPAFRTCSTISWFIEVVNKGF